jgi:chemotaxis protein MotB
MPPAIEAPIIIKKIKKGGHGHHGGSWKVAYADFVTAMMALFIVLWVLAQQEKAKKAVSLYFTEPTLTTEEIKMRLEHPNLPNSPDKTPPSKEPKKVTLYKKEQEQFKEMAKKIEDKLKTLAWYRSMKGQLLIEVTEEGLRIEFLDNSNSPFFDIGSPNPRTYTREAIAAMASEIKNFPNPVAIEGHTDRRPFRTARSYGNWELSADRANAARRILEEYGVLRIAEVRGLADVNLRDSKHPYGDSNRRVTFIVRHLAEKPAKKEAPASPAEKNPEPVKESPEKKAEAGHH